RSSFGRSSLFHPSFLHFDYLTNKKPITAVHCRDELSRYHPNYENYDSSLIINNGHDRSGLTTLHCSFNNECWWDSLQRFKSLSCFSLHIYILLPFYVL